LSVTIELPDGLKAWIEEQAQLGGHATPDAFVESILRRVQARLHKQIEEKLLQSLASGEPIDVTPGFWEERRRVLHERLKTAGKAAS
jgi:Arc/MetJ-type ribon-helix-helix transcriptional regulator